MYPEGQLVEIGGSFRITDIIEKSGATIKEVGTTNRTNLKDYENAINNKTKLILYVHTSNYTINGYTQSVAMKSLVKLGKSIIFQSWLIGVVDLSWI